MNEMKRLKKSFFAVLAAITLILSYACISHASRRAGTYWYVAAEGDGINEDQYSGYVIVDAMDARGAELKGGGQSGEPSFSSDEVELFEETRQGEYEKAGNNLLNDVITRVPVTSGDWKMITVETGATLSKISETYGVSIEDIMKSNELVDQHRLHEGQTLYIPSASESVTSTLLYVQGLKKEAVAKLKQAPLLQITDYAVKNGDTLWNIANAFNLDVNTIFGCNKFSEGNVLKVGSIVLIPNQDGIFTTVKSGETIDKLAKEYSIYPEAIISANGMKDASSLKQGERIFLPGAKVAAYVESGGKKSAVASNVKDKVTAKRGFGWPVVGKISSSYGWRRDPIRKGRDFHTGLDIRAPYGRTIVASAAGKVVHSGWMGGYGRTIVISHPGNITTLYGHCSKLLVNVGASVKRGQAIARIGSTGRSTGNHLHFEVRSGGSPMNPIKVLR
jgi:murein DD-endopeptidase MepM/ murein hydrolase activator NlpD